MKLRIGTFNLENLLSTLPLAFDDGATRWDGPMRYLKRDGLPDAAALNAALALVREHQQRQLGALVVAALDVDVLCLQEVESEQVLRQFRNEYLDPLTDGAFRHLKLFEGNDGRGIDVACLSRLPVENARNVADLTFEAVPGAWTETLARTLDRYRDDPRQSARQRYPRPTDYVFRRSLLAFDVAFGGVRVAVYVCHFKSMGTTLDPSFTTDRAYTAPLRRAEALAVRHVVRQRFGREADEALYLVCGDLNDHAHLNGERVPDADLSIAPLLDPAFAANLIEDLPPIERWTHWYDQENSFSQLDYILASPALRRANPQTDIRAERRGLPWRVPFRAARGAPAGPVPARWSTGRLRRREALALSLDGLERFPGVGFDRPAASDHAALAVSLTIPGAA